MVAVSPARERRPIINRGAEADVADFDALQRAASAGAEWAWSALYRELAPAVLGYLRARGAAEPEDLMAEVFLQVVRDFERFEGDRRSFRAWVFTIANHRLLDDRRRRARRPLESHTDPPIEVGAAAGADEEVLERASSARVREIIGRLSADQQSVLLLRILGGLTVDEVARAVRKRPGAVKALQRRGLEAVKRELAREA